MLIAIFILAILIRFLYFPENIYFSYDGARDSFAALDILTGNLKIVGPPTSLSSGLFHGVLFYYLIAPAYFLGFHNPEVVSFLLRIINALGIFLAFGLGSIIFNKWIGFLAALLFAVSYEQSQYSLIFGHPSPSPLTVLIFYLGMALFLFKNKQYGLMIALMGLGLSVQLEAVYGLLILVLLLIVIAFRKQFKNLTLKTIVISTAVFLLSVSTFILGELKFNFRSTKAIFNILNSFSKSDGSNLSDFTYIFSVIQRFFKDNLVAVDGLVNLILVLTVVILFLLYRSRDLRPKIVFLLIWFVGGFLPHILSARFSYYYSGGATVSLIILASYLIYRLFLKWKIAAVILTLMIVVGNLHLILKNNISGPNSDIIIQPGMFISDQKKVIDYIYIKAGGKPFSINALTVPLFVNTTWSYLFEWYGQERYGILPVWGGDAAAGFPGNLKIVTSRSDLPLTRFLIIEPVVGISDYIVADFINKENYFSKVIQEQKFGTIKVQKREKY